MSRYFFIFFTLEDFSSVLFPFCFIYYNNNNIFFYRLQIVIFYK
nr:MAG TPA: hypothetical protein [Caudoviricetes sp.]